MIFIYYICKINLQNQIHKMDIVSRLKTFISHLNTPVTQFADNCSIPRPTLSQLLNGRNKKVSDELIGKIHEAYPELSVLWLMFGEGDMLHKKNIEISEPEQEGIFDFQETQIIDSERLTPSIDFGDDRNKISSEKSSDTISAPNTSTLNEEGDNNIIQDEIQAIDSTDNTPTISFHPNQTKKIVNIIVYYNDNSFESFVPGFSGKS